MIGHMMTIKLLIECPICSQQYDVFLKKKAHTVIFPCSECKSLISYSSGNASIIKESLLEKIDNMKTVDDLQAVFDIINAQMDITLNKLHDNVINEDDIENLKASLERGDFWVKYMGHK